MKKTILSLTVVLLMMSGVVGLSSVSAKSLEGDSVREQVELMTYYTDFMVSYIKKMEDPANAIGFAQNTLKDMYMDSGQSQKAIDVLERAITLVADTKKRNVIRFTLADIYKDMKQFDKAQDHLLKIISENATLN